MNVWNEFKPQTIFLDIYIYFTNEVFIPGISLILLKTFKSFQFQLIHRNVEVMLLREGPNFI